MKSAAKRILFLSRDRGSVQTMIPVIERLQNNSHMSLQVVIPESSRGLLTGHGARCEPLDEAGFASDPVSCIDGILNRTRPDLVVSGSSPAHGRPPETPEQYLVMRARRLDIRSLAILDFWGMYAERFVSAGDRVDPALMPDRLCVLDRRCREDLICLGAAPDQIVITHNPWLDPLVVHGHIALHPSVLLDGHDLRILFVSQPYAETRSTRGWPFTQGSLLRGLLEALPPARPGKRHLVLIWKHPAESPGRWPETDLCKRADVMLRFGDARGAGVLAHVDLMISGHSTVAYEALHLGTPCVFFRPGNPLLPSQIVELLGLVPLADSVGALQGLLAGFDPEKSRAGLQRAKCDFQRQGYFFSDGQAANRVVAEIDSLLEE